ncbi:ArsR/SmtB family transcription factor [Pseudonocardia ammonioxydans]|uniref:ArsR/SmtB family transcription factor n=1 Tax=Pseudonocardia ammonioxydans TaxID=260086 RepID=UPI000B880399|nr:winged helix-turn-helix domain-containing protein [Pseudonocardia ammonioxydans]
MTANENLAFDALSDRVRRQILSLLGERGELTVSEIAANVDAVGRSTVSSHLRILRTSGILTERRDGRRRLYSLNADGAVRDAFRFLQSLLQTGVALDSASPDAADCIAQSHPDADHERDAS